MPNSTDIKGNSKLINKSLKYSVGGFSVEKYAPKVIIVDGKAAIKIKGRLYKMILAKS